MRMDSVPLYTLSINDMVVLHSARQHEDVALLRRFTKRPYLREPRSYGDSASVTSKDTEGRVANIPTIRGGGTSPSGRCESPRALEREGTQQRAEPDLVLGWWCKRDPLMTAALALKSDACRAVGSE